MVMIKDHPNISMLEAAAKGISGVCNDAVFVGGATIVLYINDEAVQQIRTTKDVDCSVELTSSFKYYQLEERLRKKGFLHVTEEGAPICRWKYQNVLVDIMPDDPSILGFTNSWYKEGREYKQAISLPSGTDIYIMPLEYFLASKIEAFEKRGNNDYLGSKDIEDIVSVLDGVKDLRIVVQSNNSATGFLKNNFHQFSDNQDFLESISGHVEPGMEKRAFRIIEFLKTF